MEIVVGRGTVILGLIGFGLVGFVATRGTGLRGERFVLSVGCQCC